MFRSFQYDGHWNIIYYPKKPSGFSIFVIGDSHHYVDKQDSFWLHHPGRLQLLDEFKEAGYTVFSSGFPSGNTSEEEQALFARNLYHLVMKSEILNEQIHLFAEGKGALIALKLMQCSRFIRSAVFLNPVFETKKRVKYSAPYYPNASFASGGAVRSASLTKPVKDAEASLAVPIKCIHIQGDEGCPLPLRKLQRNNAEETVFTHLPRYKRYKVPAETISFFKNHENVL